ncbi:ROK family protein [Spiroplasma alleghenense]|uniref:ROK family protein n=1 Tax=Spiroplasma alleghenense TaxID=216931 RepID=A0A345Z4X9_9MOLU|nr:ROK family protein [Spiroplasma alleghenense]AXK51658.1 ROK family protein [Spiroplasma alleghenense]
MKKYLCFDIGGLSLKYSVLDESLKEYEKGQINYELAPREEIWNSIKEIYLNLKDKISLFGIAISSSGIVDPVAGEIVYIKTGNSKKEIKKIKDLIDLKDVEIRIDNDARCALRAEQFLGAAKKSKDFAMFTIGTALGGSLCLNSQIIIGSSFSAGEIGCGFIDFNQNRNISQECGMYGLMEKYLIKTEIKKTAAQIWKEAEEKSNQVAVQLAEKQIENIASVLTNTLLLLDLELILIGGAVSKNNFFLEKLKNKVSDNFKKTGLELNAEIKSAEFENESGKIGAMLLYK